MNDLFLNPASVREAFLEETEDLWKILLDLGHVLLDLGFVVHLFAGLTTLLLLLLLLLLASVLLLLLLTTVLLLLLLTSILLLLLLLALPCAVVGLSTERVSSLVLRLAILLLVVTDRSIAVVLWRLRITAGQVDVHSALVLLCAVLQAELAANVLDRRLDLLDVVGRVITLADDTEARLVRDGHGNT